MADTDTNIVSFAKLETPKDKPHFLDVQTKAFERLLQPDLEGEERRDVGLKRVFSEIFPITDVNENFALEFVDYELGDPKYTVEECMERDMTYAAPLKATLRLVMYEDVGEGEKRPRDILEKDPPYGAKVAFTADQSATGWNAPEVAPWLDDACQAASRSVFGAGAMYMGEGGTIPFMAMLGESFPEAQFLITGVLGPHSNAHGPNEFLHVPYARKLTLCVARVLADHADAGKARRAA